MFPGQAVRPSSGNHHVAGLDRYPLVPGGIEPRKPQIVPSVQVGMLAVGEPPASLVVTGTVGVRDVPVNVDGGELHVVLVLEGIGRVPLVTGQLEPEAILPRPNPERLVIRKPGIVVDVLHHNPKRRAVVVGKMVQRLIADPKLPGRRPKPIRVILPGPIKVNRPVLAPLNRGPLVLALGHQRMVLTNGGNQVQVTLTTLTRPLDLALTAVNLHLLDLGAVAGQLANDGLVLGLDVLQLLHQPGGALQLRQPGRGVEIGARFRLQLEMGKMGIN